MKFTTISSICFIVALLAHGASIDALRSKAVVGNSSAAIAPAEPELPVLPDNVQTIYARICRVPNFTSTAAAVKTLTVLTIDGCLQWCRMTSDCTHISYNANNKECILRKGRVGFKNQDGVITQPLECNISVATIENTNSKTKDYLVVSGSSIDACHVTCSTDYRCSHYTFNKANNECHLKTSQMSLVSGTNWVTGRPCLWENISSYGTAVSDAVKIPTMLYCLDYCQGQGNCTHITYNTKSMMCVLRNGLTKLMVEQGGYTALKFCRNPSN